MKTLNLLIFESFKPELFDGNQNIGLYQPHHIEALMKYLPQPYVVLILILFGVDDLIF